MPTPSDSPLSGAYAPLTPADAIRLWMDHYELSETDVALATGLLPNTVTRLLRGSQSVTDEIAQALAVATGIAASRWSALQRHHAVWTAYVDSVLAALGGPQRAVLPIRSARLTPLGDDGRVRPNGRVVTKGFGYVEFTIDHDQEPTVVQPRRDQPLEIPTHTGSTLHALADVWDDRVGLDAGPKVTASVIVELATLMRATGIAYLNPSDLETLAVAVRSIAGGSPSVAEPDTADGS